LQEIMNKNCSKRDYKVASRHWPKKKLNFTPRINGGRKNSVKITIIWRSSYKRRKISMKNDLIRKLNPIFIITSKKSETWSSFLFCKRVTASTTLNYSYPYAFTLSKVGHVGLSFAFPFLQFLVFFSTKSVSFEA
jgi:hypothetical protein